MIPNFPELSFFDILKVDNLILSFELLVFLFVLHKIKTVNDSYRLSTRIYRVEDTAEEERTIRESCLKLPHTDEMTEEERTVRESCLNLHRHRVQGFLYRMKLKKYFEKNGLDIQL